MDAPYSYLRRDNQGEKSAPPTSLQMLGINICVAPKILHNGSLGLVEVRFLFRQAFASFSDTLKSLIAVTLYRLSLTSCTPPDVRSTELRRISHAELAQALTQLPYPCPVTAYKQKLAGRLSHLILEGKR